MTVMTPTQLIKFVVQLTENILPLRHVIKITDEISHKLVWNHQATDIILHNLNRLELKFITENIFNRLKIVFILIIPHALIKEYPSQSHTFYDIDLCQKI